ncbi:hypothetical protein CH63R_10047 [Colletotrichum higginsianum IMI 349063]|uniref:Uncharacterized protein n=2 Tax=Colletotrichum higginsianum TaxID=80884 RepID=A0A1B7Y1R5_COLHI|nr:uncharacterized protein CH63R_10047 [Colletotrichum higginsianum IMI 349063]OBR05927.1 hypothetical protein CH63R_10047 [Colletotrichum higginsianum IMI 349063]TIC97321.1 hypothetical protein CH35J_006917 [Colletotrichum higginsianum]GJD01833.1 hypothetical protein ColKHC_10658 [Colletotrichum higginsianum]
MAPSRPSSGPDAPKLPASADFNALYNRISLASAKQATFLTSMRAKYPSLARSTSAKTPSTAAAAPAATNGGTFSSLGRPEPEPTAAAAAAPAAPSKTPRDDADLRFENPNTGLGYAAPKSEQAASAATRDLSRRLLGNKRGRAEDPKTAAAAALAKRRLQDEESEEEEGRSGVGRSKKRKVRRESPEPAGPEPTAAAAAASAPVVEVTAEKADVEMHEGDDAPAEVSLPDDVQGTTRAGAERQDASGSVENVAVPADPAESGSRPDMGETSKKRRKKNRNKKNKAAAAAAAAGASEREDE